jgi:hypothetical protein
MESGSLSFYDLKWKPKVDLTKLTNKKSYFFGTLLKKSALGKDEKIISKAKDGKTEYVLIEMPKSVDTLPPVKKNKVKKDKYNGDVKKPVKKTKEVDVEMANKKKKKKTATPTVASKKGKKKGGKKK